MGEIIVRHVETADAQALQQLYAHPNVYRDTLQLPLPSLAHWQQRLTDAKPGLHNLVACIDEQVVGQIVIQLHQSLRRRHVAPLASASIPRSKAKGSAARSCAR
ncbi:putative acetyltransferase YhhY [Serratia rubidaea]|uniref:Putative acetyltransferase YhhY n=1 Tax=Serratia rubidaea TaxID=61652 RepID=A0A4V6JIH8_SERRU|nr:putative acetyltransferase YhhY [Serratia rubidaea]